MPFRRLKPFARDWNTLAKRNAYGAILTGEAGTIAPWNSDEFFATGRADVERFVEALGRVAPHVSRRRALDFGCGVGRITRWLAAHFDSVVGVDVAPTMIARARALNADVANCEFVLNPDPHLKKFDTGSFDVIYSRLVLQHIPPVLVRRYIAELVRVLSPGGVLMFQLPEAIEPPLKTFLHAPVRGGRRKQAVPLLAVRAYRLLKYTYLILTSGPRMRMAGLPFGEVAGLIRQSGGTLVTAIADDSHGIPGIAGFEYWVTRS